VLDLEVNAFVQRLAAAVHARGEPWIRDVVPALGGLALHFDPDFEGVISDVAAELVERCLKDGLPDAENVGREVEVPVCYDRVFAPDLEEVAAKVALSPEPGAKPGRSVVERWFAPGQPAWAAWMRSSPCRGGAGRARWCRWARWRSPTSRP
jgi:hypothetical protein